MFRVFLGSDDDWIEMVRVTLYPRLHPFLELVGGYGVGFVGENQRVGRIEVGEEVFEEILEDLGFRRNPIACLKHDHDGDVSEGSWVLLSGDDPEGRLARDRQLHLTMLPADDGPGLDVFAHEEYDWRVAPLKHLREVDFEPEAGAARADELLTNKTYLAVSE